MSELKGKARCPQCGGLTWSVEDWSTYKSVVCAKCGAKVGELNETGLLEDKVPIARYEEDPTMRDVAFTALLGRSAWFADLKTNDSHSVITQFLQDWRSAQVRHASGGQTIYGFAAAWSHENRGKFQGLFPYLTPARNKSRS